MKPVLIIFSLLLCVTFFSCDDDSNSELVIVATPEIMSKSDFRKSVEIKGAQPIAEPGKIYIYNNYIFVGDVNKGVHIIDNTNPASPQPLSYIEIPGNEDISVKNNYLYADSATDLVVFDISEINNVKQVERLEDVFEIYNYQIPLEAEYTDFGTFNYETDIIVGWNVKRELREKVNEDSRVWGVAEVFVNDAAAPSNVGVGGSLARFQIINNYLYTVGQYSMSIFNIQNLSNPVLETTQNAGWNIETMFSADGYLYLGSTNGMYIYDLKTPSSPEYVSEFTHWEGCDPVVVDGDYAYLTLRGGNMCGQDESVLEVIDISDKSNPTLAKRYTLENPYGLGVKDDMLYVCDGTAGLKLFKRNTPVELDLVKTLKEAQATDVIPLENSLIMIGENTLYQYEYMVNNVALISAYSLN
ncbi:hypothetical protein EYD45_11450 [Hyunsoonleella flava]|uniref:LVIVD repeat-containing protein n=1 Tax=Hyunsoonleella flava TaxID=2527939 RepID=A0A4V2JA01_9FLAO|nr:hypothetical protein [Hyunsoonleella flava]TBN02733.1 hypothetical protein EYD45_11450 [Hyunsoonleella flava]